MTLRVIAGEYGGRVLKSVRGIGTRPLLGQVREALFNILGPRVEDAVVWDLFAGTGASGIEALSRGARAVTFVEKSNQALAVLRENLRMLGAGATDRSVVIKGDAWSPPTGEGEREGEEEDEGEDEDEAVPDLIFLDPPYAKVSEDPVLCAYRASQLAQQLAPGGSLLFHFPDGLLDADDFDADLQVVLRRWGRTAVAFLAAPDGQPAPDASSLAINRRD